MEVVYRSGRKPVSDFLLYLFYLIGLTLFFVLINKMFNLDLLGQVFYVTAFILLTSFVILYCFNKHIVNIKVQLAKNEVQLEYRRLLGSMKTIAISFSNLDLMIEKKTKTIGLGEPQLIISFFNNKQFVKDIAADDFEEDFAADLIQLLNKKQVPIKYA